MAVFVIIVDADDHVEEVKIRNEDGVLEDAAELNRLRSIFGALRRRNPLTLVTGEVNKYLALAHIGNEPGLTDEEKERYRNLILRMEPTDTIKYEVRSIFERIPPVLRWGGSDGGRASWNVVNYFIDP